MWVRGLKHLEHDDDAVVKWVAPHVGAWIETAIGAGANVLGGSHPMWVRGLKLVCLQVPKFHQRSHPMWVRGLKHKSEDYLVICTEVAPHVGAWIETIPTARTM